MDSGGSSASLYQIEKQIQKAWICRSKVLQHFHLQKPLLLTWINFILSERISNYIHYKVWDEIIYPFTTDNTSSTEVWLLNSAGINVNPC